MSDRNFGSMRGDARKAITGIEPKSYTELHLDPPSTKEQRRQANMNIAHGVINGTFYDHGVRRGAGWGTYGTPRKPIT